jgi:hypothetical protein
MERRELRRVGIAAERLVMLGVCACVGFQGDSDGRRSSRPTIPIPGELQSGNGTAKQRAREAFRKKSKLRKARHTTTRPTEAKLRRDQCTGQKSPDDRLLYIALHILFYKSHLD